MVWAAYLIGHHGRPTKNAIALTRRLQTARAREAKVKPEAEKLILEKIIKHTAGWDGSKRSKMSEVIATELKGTAGELTSRAILNRLKKLFPSMK